LVKSSGRDIAASFGSSIRFVSAAQEAQKKTTYSHVQDFRLRPAAHQGKHVSRPSPFKRHSRSLAQPVILSLEPSLAPAPALALPPVQ
jgi:hypothetical protein